MLSKNEILSLLKTKEIPKNLLEEAYKVRKYYSGKYVFFRALIEISNICQKACFYCGVNRENKNLKRYYINLETLKKIFEKVKNLKYTSVAIQSGEIISKKHFEFLKKIVTLAKSKYNFEITLSLGELPKKILKELFLLGARRYLLRFEVATPKRYYLYHYKDNLHSYENRIKTLYTLKEIGYQVGTGFLVGLPFDNPLNLYKDIRLIQKLKPDMIGIGPYIPQKYTKLFNLLEKGVKILNEKDRFFLNIKLIAIFRILLKTPNIVASTALITLGTKFFPLEEVLNFAFKAGANVIMPVFTPSKEKKLYALYENKYFSEHEKFYDGTLKASFIPVLERYGNPISYYIRNFK